MQTLQERLSLCETHARDRRYYEEARTCLEAKRYIEFLERRIYCLEDQLRDARGKPHPKTTHSRLIQSVFGG